jgi:hypothetical protein
LFGEVMLLHALSALALSPPESHFSTAMETMPCLDTSDYSLAVKNKGRPPRPWRWEIYAAGKSKPVRQSEFFETMSEATRAGKLALAELRGRAV